MSFKTKQKKRKEKHLCLIIVCIIILWLFKLQMKWKKISFSNFNFHSIQSSYMIDNNGKKLKFCLSNKQTLFIYYPLSLADLFVPVLLYQNQTFKKDSYKFSIYVKQFFFCSLSDNDKRQNVNQKIKKLNESFFLKIRLL